jgi:predicted SprT family Zn-dependent metalloprotease
MRQLINKTSPNHQYITLAAAFDFFNRRLFAGKLPPAIITLQRKAGSHGYYSARRFEGRGDDNQETDEIALNPGTFAGRSDSQILSTLVHEMTHHWQRHFGKPGRGRYHNQEWADKMESMGLVATHTGAPGGSPVGQRMTHYIVIGGLFDLACDELFAGGVRLEWQSREWHAHQDKPRTSKAKYSCSQCGLNAWAKPYAHLICGNCNCRLLGELDGEENPVKQKRQFQKSHGER